MTTLTTADLTSNLVDLTTIPLTALRELDDPALVRAIELTYENAALNTGNELQDQAR